MVANVDIFRPFSSCDCFLPSTYSLNSFLKRPRSGRTAFQEGHKTDDDLYTWLASRPMHQKSFHRFMEFQFASLPTWLDGIDFERELGKDLGENGVAFVDVGGGAGQQCALFKQKLPQVRGRIILQDRPDTLGEGTLDVEGMEQCCYDYFTQQPIKGPLLRPRAISPSSRDILLTIRTLCVAAKTEARVYFFRQILHNNSDDACIRILQAQLPALGDNSVVIINEKVLPEKKPRHDDIGIEYTSGLSIHMMALFKSCERREDQWRQILSRAGFEVREVRIYTRYHDGIIIAAKK